jgi:hypothetical protein
MAKESHTTIGACGVRVVGQGEWEGQGGRGEVVRDMAHARRERRISIVVGSCVASLEGVEVLFERDGEVP